MYLLIPFLSVFVVGTANYYNFMGPHPGEIGSAFHRAGITQTCPPLEDLRRFAQIRRLKKKAGGREGQTSII